MNRTHYLLLLSIFCSSTLIAAPGNTLPQLSKQKTHIDKLKNNTGLIPAKALPELSIQHFSLIPDSVKNGQGFMYQLSVKNSGGASSSNMMLVSLSHTPQYGSPQKLKVPGPGETLHYKGQTSNHPKTCGSITFTAKIDAHNQVNESNENNNTATAQVMVHPRTDLGVCDFTGYCPKLSTVGKVNKEILVQVDVTNYGCIANAPSRIWINCPEQWPTPTDIPPIEPGKFWPHGVSFKWKKPGTYTCKIFIDSEKTLDEAKENNNRINFKVTVTN